MSFPSIDGNSPTNLSLVHFSFVLHSFWLCLHSIGVLLDISATTARRSIFIFFSFFYAVISRHNDASIFVCTLCFSSFAWFPWCIISLSPPLEAGQYCFFSVDCICVDYSYHLCFLIDSFGRLLCTLCAWCLYFWTWVRVPEVMRYIEHSIISWIGSFSESSNCRNNNHRGHSGEAARVLWRSRAPAPKRWGYASWPLKTCVLSSSEASWSLLLGARS